MGSPDEIQVLFGKIDKLNDGISGVRETIGDLRGDVKVLTAQMDHKAEKDEISRDIHLHAMECNTRKRDPGGFWSGMSAAQKTTIVTTTMAAVGSTVAMILQNLI